MKLFLASAASNVIGEFVKLLDKAPEEFKVAFIPTAADPYKDKFFVELDRNALLDGGFNITDINIAGMKEDVLKENLKGIDIIFVAGGNVFYLLEKARESGFDKILKEFADTQRWYAGSSAGSMIVGSTIEPAKVVDDPKEAKDLKDYDGVGLVNRIIVPHYKNDKFVDKIDKLLDDHSHLLDKIVKLTDQQALFVDGEKTKVISVKEE